MTNYKINLTDEEKELVVKAREIKAQLEAEGKWPVKPMYRQLEVLLGVFGTKELGLKKLLEPYLMSAMEYYGGYNRHKDVASFDIEVVYAKFLAEAMKQKGLFSFMYSTDLSDFQDICAKVKKDTIDIRVNASEAGATPAKKTGANNGPRPKYNKRIDPALSATIAKVSKPGEQYRFDLLLSTLEKEGFHVELKGDVAEVYVDAEDKMVEAGIIRYSSPVEMAEDLSTLCEKCPLINGQRRINVSVVINKVLGSKNVENKREESKMKKTKTTLQAVINILVANGATVNDPEDQTLRIVVGEKSLQIAVSSPIQFARRVYKLCGSLFAEEDAARIRKALEELFGSSKNDTDPDYDNLAAEAPASGIKLNLILSLLYKGKNVPVKRQIVSYDEGNDFYAGAVLNGSKKVGTFYWNANFMKPVFKPEPGPVDMGLENKTRYATAIKAALEKAGIKCKAKPRHETQVLFEEAV